ncbi:hypothetical protein Trydic_g362 [Trypoxylus dichotomus]
MATQIRPLGNSFCNYADDTLGGHFEIKADDQSGDGRLSEGVATLTTQTCGWTGRFPVARGAPTSNIIKVRQVKLWNRNSLVRPPLAPLV